MMRYRKRWNGGSGDLGNESWSERLGSTVPYACLSLYRPFFDSCLVWRRRSDEEDYRVIEIDLITVMPCVDSTLK